MTQDEKPIACTLGAGDFKTRIDWIRRLNRGGLRDQRRDGLELCLLYAPGSADDVRELVRRETACCGFLRFDLRETPDAVELTVTAPEEAREAAETMFAQLAVR